MMIQEHVSTSEDMRGLRQALDVQIIKDYFDRVFNQENYADFVEGSDLVLEAKDRFFKIVCRVMKWDDWLEKLEAQAGVGSRSVPDPIIEEFFRMYPDIRISIVAKPTLDSTVIVEDASV